ncbi:MAG: hypothetical protein KJZ93_00075 [Caldilineaceae bacterium]|nr:hypothetical protein [Caldilineaceae bacterium]
MWVVELQVLGVLALALWLPGHALLIITKGADHWPGLQLPIVVIGLSAASYPVFYYGVRFVAPSVGLTSTFLWAILGLCGLVVVFARLRGQQRRDRWQLLEWVAVGLVALTLATRLWVANEYPYPAWADSLHHVLLTGLTAEAGRLPYTLAPYFPVDVDMYHLGFYAIAGTVQGLTSAPAHTALLWTAQVFSGLAGLGVYLALDRYSGRVGAVVGLAIVGLFSFQPAFYVNWGRFTQLASQALLLTAWVVTLEALRSFVHDWRQTHRRAEIIAQALLAALLTAAVCLLHFRVAAFYAPALLLGIMGWAWRWRGQGQWRALFIGLVWIGGLTLLLILPTLWTALRAYIEALAYTATVAAIDPATRGESIERYYAFPWSTVTALAAPTWLWLLTAVATIGGLARRNPLTLFALTWLLLLVLEGSAYRLGIPALMFTNMGAVLILLYLPIGLLVGAGGEALVQALPLPWQPRAVAALMLVVLVGALPAARLRITQIEPYRFFVTEADVTAMTWIQRHIPPQARFAVNTEFWLPNVAHGTDAGYWIPYFTQRETTAGVMIMRGAYLQQVADWSRAVVQLEADPGALNQLYAMGVEYIYLGARGHYARPGLNLETLRQWPDLRLLYEHDGVAILQITPQNR